MEDLEVVILAKPRHEGLIAEVRGSGAGVVEIPDGDVMGSLRALVPGGGVDACLGVGGTPEGVVTACAVRLLGGDMQGRLAPQSEEERQRVHDSGTDLDAVLGVEDMVASPDCLFAATGVTGATFLSAPQPTPDGWRTSSLLVTPSGGIAFVETLGEREPPPRAPEDRSHA